MVSYWQYQVPYCSSMEGQYWNKWDQLLCWWLETSLVLLSEFNCKSLRVVWHCKTRNHIKILLECRCVFWKNLFCQNEQYQNIISNWERKKLSYVNHMLLVCFLSKNTLHALRNPQEIESTLRYVYILLPLLSEKTTMTIISSCIISCLLGCSNVTRHN
jgi:hypothetical protein